MPAKRRPLDPEDRKAFDCWAGAVTAFYALMVVGLLAAHLFGSRLAPVEKTPLSAGPGAAGHDPLRERHP